MKKILTERFQELAGIRPLYQLNENFPIVFNGNGKVRDVLGKDTKTEENSSSYRSIANGGDVSLQVNYLWKGEGALQLFVTVGDKNSIKYRHPDNVDESKVISFIEEVKPEIKDALEARMNNNPKEYLGKAHIGFGYEDKIVDEDVTRVKAGIEKFDAIKPSKV